MRKVILIGILLVYSNLYAQNKYGNTLTFGINKGLEFTDTSAHPRVFKSQCHFSYLNSAAISNKEGKLLMYYAQDTIGSGKFWSYKDHGYIADSFGHKITGADSVYSQLGEDAACIFLTDPVDSNIYWFFAIERNPSDTGYYLSYTKFRASATSITVIDRNQHFYDYYFRNALRAIRHGNGRDWWIISKNDGSNEWIRFLLTPSGLSQPQFQTYGTLVYTYGGDGALGISLDGKHIFIPDQIIITSFNFDRCTGLLSNYQRFYDGTKGGSSLNYYLSVFYDTLNKIVIGGGNQNIIQYSLNTTDTLITKFKTIKTLTSYSDTSNGNGYGTIFYNPFNPKHLYINISQENSACAFYSDSLRNTISLINYSDTSNIKVIDKFITTDSSEIFFPVFIQPNFNLGRLVGSACDTITETTNIIEFKPELKVYPNPSKFSFNITSSEYGNVTIYDVLGRAILTENIEPGDKSINCSQWPQGVYIVTVKYRNGYVENRKIVKE